MMGQAGAEAADVAGEAMDISNSITKKGADGVKSGAGSVANIFKAKK